MPAVNMKNELARLRLLRRLSKAMLELIQLVIDTEAWNQLHPNEQQFDTQLDREALKRFDRCILLVATRQNCKVEYQQLVEQLELLGKT